MQGFSANIAKETVENNDFRRVLYTGQHTQLVLMSLPVGGEIGSEVHSENDQFFRFETGTGSVTIGDNQYDVTNGSAIVVPAGAEHNVVNTSASESLKLYTLYSPPHHADGTVHSTKDVADAAEHDHDH